MGGGQVIISTLCSPAEIFAKNILVMSLHTKPQPNFMFSQISWSRVMGFSNHFLHLNCRIVMFVLSIIKGM